MNHTAFFADESLLSSTVAAVDWDGIRNNVAEFVSTYPLFVSCVLLVLLLFLLALQLRCRRARRGIRVYQEDGGFAVVSQKALRHLIYIACEDAGLASSPRIRFRKVKGRINVEIGLKLFQNQRLSDVHDLLRERIRVAVEETHGIGVGEVNLSVLGFRKDPYRREAAHDEPEIAEAQSEPDAYRPVPGEASAASLYDEPSTDETTGEDESEQSAEAGVSDESVEEAPKKRRFGLFGRKKEAAAEPSLFVNESEDANPSFAMDETEPSDSQPTQDGAKDASNEKDRA